MIVIEKQKEVFYKKCAAYACKYGDVKLYHKLVTYADKIIDSGNAIAIASFAKFLSVSQN